MKPKFTIIAILLLSAYSIKSYAQPGYAGEWKKTRLYGHTYDQNDFTDEQYQWIADNHELFCVEKPHMKNIYNGPFHEKASKSTATRLKELNPKCKTIAIYSIHKAYTSWFESEAKALEEHPDYFIYEDGKPEELNLLNPDENDWYVETTNNLVDSSDLVGIFVDGLQGAIRSHKKETEGILPRMHGLSLINGFHLTQDRTKFYEGLGTLKKCAGVFVDSWFRRLCDNTTAGQTMIDTCMTVPEDKIMVLYCTNDMDGFWGTDHTFSHAAYLIVAHKNTYYRWAGDGLWGPDVLMEYHEDFDKEMGEPLSKAVKTGYAYERVFKHCRVKLNVQKKTSFIEWGQNNTLKKAKGVSVESPQSSIEVDESLQLKTVFSPVDATYQGVTWSVDNSNIASISEIGQVTGRSPGKATITAIASDGGFVASCEINVNPIAVTGITISATDSVIVKGEGLQLTANIIPTNAAVKGVDWRSSNSDVAPVNTKGFVRGRDVGKATITAISNDGGYTATFHVDVVAPTGTVVLANTEKEPGISIFPNPANDQLFYEITTLNHEEGIEIYNCAGHLLQNHPVENRIGQIDVSKLGRGTYLVKLKSNQSTAERFIKS